MKSRSKVTAVLIAIALFATGTFLTGCKKGEQTDIVVIGGGGAGLSAAVTAAENGAKVVLVEKMPMLGGNTLRAQTGFNAAGTKYQADAGITDSADTHYQDTMKGGKDKNDPALVKTLTENAKDSLEWLNGLGASLTKMQLLGGATNARTHAPTEGGYAGPVMIEVMEKAAREKGVQILLETRATEILVDKDGKVTGVKATDKDGKEIELNSKAVVIATGGFGANNEMVAKYNPKLAGFDTTNHKGATGDGIVMAEAIGAALRDMEYIQIHPTVVPGKGVLIAEGMRGQGAILVNSKGERFVQELKTRDLVSEATLEQEGKYAFVLFDQAIRDTAQLVEAPEQQSSLVSGDTLEELAEKIGVPAEALVETVTKYNTYVEAGEDPEFSRVKMPAKIEVGPFWAVKVTPAIHHTMAGVAINSKAQVLDADGNAIPGLYAAGEVTGGVHGANRLGGNALCDIIVFGRIAGKESASFATAK